MREQHFMLIPLVWLRHAVYYFPLPCPHPRRIIPQNNDSLVVATVATRAGLLVNRYKALSSLSFSPPFFLRALAGLFARRHPTEVRHVFV